MLLASEASDFLKEAGALVGGGAALGATAGFVGWLLTAPIMWWVGRGQPHQTRVERDQLGIVLAISAGLGGIGGFVVWLYEHQGVI